MASAACFSVLTMRILILYSLTGFVLGAMPPVMMQANVNNVVRPSITGIPTAPQANPPVIAPTQVPVVPQAIRPQILPQQPPIQPPSVPARTGIPPIPPVTPPVTPPKPVAASTTDLSYSQKIGLDMIYKQIKELLEEDRLAKSESQEVKLGRQWMTQFPDSPFNSELGKKLAQMERARKAQLNLKLYLLMEQKKSILSNSKKIYLKEDLKAKQARLRKEYKSLMGKFVTFFHKIQNMSTKKIKSELNQTMNRIKEQNKLIESKNILLQNTLNQKLDSRVNQSNSSMSQMMNQGNSVNTFNTQSSNTQQMNSKNSMSNSLNNTENRNANNSNIVNSSMNVMNNSQNNRTSNNMMNNLQSNSLKRNIFNTTTNAVNKVNTSKNISNNSSSSSTSNVSKKVDVKLTKTEKQLKTLETKLEKRFKELKKAATPPMMGCGCGCGGCCKNKKKNEEEAEEEGEEEEEGAEESEETSEEQTKEEKENEEKAKSKKKCKTVIQTICEEETDSKTAKEKVAKAKAKKALQAKKVKKQAAITAMQPTYQLGPCGCRPGIT